MSTSIMIHNIGKIEISVHQHENSDGKKYQVLKLEIEKIKRDILGTVISKDWDSISLFTEFGQELDIDMIEGIQNHVHN